MFSLLVDTSPSDRKKDYGDDGFLAKMSLLELGGTTNAGGNLLARTLIPSSPGDFLVWGDPMKINGKIFVSALPSDMNNIFQPNAPRSSCPMKYSVIKIMEEIALVAEDLGYSYKALIPYKYDCTKNHPECITTIWPNDQFLTHNARMLSRSSTTIVAKIRDFYSDLDTELILNYYKALLFTATGLLAELSMGGLILSSTQQHSPSAVALANYC